MRILALAVLLLISGCASVSRETCLEGDWVRIGQQDGAAGRVAERQFERHEQACARVDIIPDRSAWMQGYEAGLRQYCTPLNGLREGEAGRLYRDVCPSSSEAGFLRGYDLGIAAYRQRQRINDIQREINALAGSRFSRRGDGDGLREWPSSSSDLLASRLDLMQARAELDRIEREIRAFRAAQ